MRLPAMMRLVLEEMGEDIVATILLDTRATMDIDRGREAVFIKPSTKAISTSSSSVWAVCSSAMVEKGSSSAKAARPSVPPCRASI